jgi:tRNA pseudouridine55 synthase
VGEVSAFGFVFFEGGGDALAIPFHGGLLLTRCRSVGADRDVLGADLTGCPPRNITGLTMIAKDGVLLLDKPAGMSSAGMLNRLKRRLPRGTKLGHAGTLDPFATGLLLALVGKGTKRCESMMGQPKTYVATVKLGATTDTLDPESPERACEELGVPTEEQVRAALSGFRGPVLQTPPPFSAIKVGGRRAYDLARKGRAVELAPRVVQAYRVEATRYAHPYLELEMEVGRGFYVRSLARDLGRALGSGGYLTLLRRTRIGEFSVADAVGLEDISAENIWSRVVGL